MKARWIIFSALLIGAFFSITACHRVPAYVDNPTVENLSAQDQQLLRDIEGSGIQVIKQGMLFTFVIPTDCFFSKDTRALKEKRERDLDRLAQFLNHYGRYFAAPTITIAGYTDKTWISPARDLLSLHYAETIATYLREDGLNSNMISVDGLGAKRAIASNSYPMGASFNRRIEVTISTSAVAQMKYEQEKQQAAAMKKQAEEKIIADRERAKEARRAEKERRAAAVKQAAESKRIAKAKQAEERKQIVAAEKAEKMARLAAEKQAAETKRIAEAKQAAEIAKMSEEKTVAVNTIRVAQAEKPAPQSASAEMDDESLDIKPCTGAACV